MFWHGVNLMDRIILTNLEIFGRHGCSVEEQRRGQIFKVDVELNLNLSKAGASDDIGDTVDYAAVMFDVEKIVAGTPRKLIETVAEEIAAALLEKFAQVDSVKVAVHKPNAPLPIKYLDAAVEICRSRK